VLTIEKFKLVSVEISAAEVRLLGFEISTDDQIEITRLSLCL